jgi:hypothetical protein
MEQNPGKKIIKDFINEEIEKKRKNLYEESLNFLYKGEIKKALMTINDSMLLLLKAKLDMTEENKLQKDLMLLKNANISGITDEVCFQGMSSINVDNDLVRAQRLSIGLQNLIKEKNRPAERREREFIETTEDFIKRLFIS